MSQQRDPLPYVLIFIVVMVGLALSARMYQTALRRGGWGQVAALCQQVG